MSESSVSTPSMSHTEGSSHHSLIWEGVSSLGSTTESVESASLRLPTSWNLLTIALNGTFPSFPTGIPLEPRIGLMVSDVQPLAFEPVLRIPLHGVEREEPAVFELVAVAESGDQMAHHGVHTVIQNVFGYALLVKDIVDPDHPLEDGTSRGLVTSAALPAKLAVHVVGDEAFVPQTVDAVVEVVVGSDALLGEIPLPLQEILPVGFRQFGGCDVLDEAFVVVSVPALDLGEEDFCETCEYVVGCPVEVVGDGEADPVVGSLPSDLEIFEGCEFGSDILVAVSCSDGLENHRKVVVGYGAVLLVEGGDENVTFGGSSIPHGFSLP